MANFLFTIHIHVFRCSKQGRQNVVHYCYRSVACEREQRARVQCNSDISEKKSLTYISGWKGVARAVGRSERIVREWHYKLCNLPMIKVGHPRYGKFFVTPIILHAWLHEINRSDLTIKI